MTAHALPAPAAPSDTEAETQRRKLALLFRNAGQAQLVAVVNATLLVFVHASLRAVSAIDWIWLGLAFSIAAERYVLARRFAPPRRSVLGQVDGGQRRYVAATGLAGFVWGTGAILFMWEAPDDMRLFTGLVMVGMVAGAVPLLAPIPAAFRAFALPVLLASSLTVLLQATSPLDWVFGLMILLFAGVALLSARYLHETLDASIRLGLEQARQAADLACARDAAEAELAERVRAETTLLASEERYRLILEHSPTGILHYDAGLVITYCNDRLAHIFQTPRERLIGLDMNILRDRRILSALQSALDGGQGRYEGEYLSTLSGARLWIAVTCAPLRNADGVPAGGIAIFEDMSEQHQSEEEIRQLAFYDPLTHLPNRRLLLDRLEHALQTGERAGEYGALMILDLDHFKSINDTQGHDIGDRMLLETALRLVVCVRREDTVARLGGDEYVVLLERLGPTECLAIDQAGHIAEKIRLTLGQPYILGGGEAEYFITPSLGLTLFRNGETPADSLLKQADVALYQAKDAGRNTIRFFNPAMQAAIDTRISLEHALRRALEREEFHLFYQPQVDRHGQLTGAEALIRWQPDECPALSPNEFIAVAEETGLILPIGQWVLETACAQIKAWSTDPRTRALHLSVNVSARQFHQPDFVDQIQRCLTASGIDPTRLKLELTEHAVLDNLDTVIERMHALIRLGIGFSLDDFGTGYSSLSYLKRLPLTQVKIDRSFVGDVTHNAHDAAIVRAILAMCRSLDLETVAEGIETREQLDFLLNSGCTLFQGYLFGHPAPMIDWDIFLEPPSTAVVREADSARCSPPTGP